MFFDREAAVAATQEQVLAAFSGEQAAVIQASTANSERSRQFFDFVRGAPEPECERHGTEEWDKHFGMILGFIYFSDKNPDVHDYGTEIMAAVMVYNRHIIGTGRDRNLMVRFRYDPKTQTCYMPAGPAARAFNYYNSLAKPPLLKDIPNPLELAFDMEEAHGYSGGISDRVPMRQEDTPAFRLHHAMLGGKSLDCGQFTSAVMDLGNGNSLCCLQDNKGLHTVFVPQRDI